MASILSDYERYVPNPCDNRNLSACLACKLIMHESQWSKLHWKCPNCRVDVDVTQDFVGMISLMMPQESWVARWNEIRYCIPGVYAIKVPEANEDEEEEEVQRGVKGKKGKTGKEHEEDDDMRDFLVPDDE